jgi:branched-chain amino acid transport system permease protein
MSATATAGPRPVQRTEQRLKLAAYGLVLLVAIAIPFFFGSYRVGQFTLVLAYAVAVLGLNLLVGYGGLISLGHGAFFALGAYTSAILIEKADFPYLATLPPAAAVCFAAGLVLGLPALRIRGLYLALVTLGVAIAMPQLIKRFDELTGGTQGLNVAQPTAPGWLPLADDQFLYLLTLVLAIPMFVLAANLVRGRTGRALVAMRESEVAAKAMGVDLARLKTSAFAISSMYAGVAGALYVFSIGFVAPESFTLTVSFAFLAAIVVGGLATIGGAIFGALFIEFVPVYASDVSDALAGVIYGAVLIAFMYALRGGVMGLLRDIGRQISSRLSREEGKERPGEPAQRDVAPPASDRPATQPPAMRGS